MHSTVRIYKLWPVQVMAPFTHYMFVSLHVKRNRADMNRYQYFSVLSVENVYFCLENQQSMSFDKVFFCFFETKSVCCSCQLFSGGYVNASFCLCKLDPANSSMHAKVHNLMPSFH